MKIDEIKELGLTILENGRINNEQMNQIIGAGESCGMHNNCGTNGKNDCYIYSKCQWFSKVTCDVYVWLTPDTIDI
jgi:hypothetical protein